MRAAAHFARVRPGAHPLLASPCYVIIDSALALTGSRLEVTGRLPDRPVLIATNSTQRNDFIALRRIVHAAGHDAVTLMKPKYLQSAIARAFLGQLGGIPLASRGFLITHDFRSLLGRRPGEAEYRALRDHVDHDQPIDTARAPGAGILMRTRHSLLGRSFDPARQSYPDFVRDVFLEVTEGTLETLRQSVAARRHVHV